MRNYTKLLPLILLLCCFLFALQNLSAQKETSFSLISDISTEAYGNQIIIADHIPDGGPKGITQCDNGPLTELYYSSVSNTPSLLFIPWSDISSSTKNYQVVVNGNTQGQGNPAFNSETLFEYYITAVEYINKGSLRAKISGKILVFDEPGYPKYSISFHELGMLIKFINGSFNWVRVYETCTPNNNTLEASTNFDPQNPNAQNSNASKGGISKEAYGNQIIIADHIPDGGGSLALLPCQNGTPMELFFDSIPSNKKEMFIPWSALDTTNRRDFYFLINGNQLTSGNPVFHSEAYFEYQITTVEYVNKGKFRPKIKNGKLVFKETNYPKYTITFLEAGILVSFKKAKFNWIKIYEECEINYAIRQRQFNDLELKAQPNPFQNSTVLNYSIPQKTSASLSIYNNLGQKTKTIFANKSLEAGQYQEEIFVDLPSGIYYLILESALQRKVLKILIE